MESETTAKKASMTGLAIVGFVTLIILGLWLALYVARLLTGPTGLGAVADYVGDLFAPAPTGTLAVVPDGTTTIPFGNNTDTTTPDTTDDEPDEPATEKPAAVPTSVPAPTYYRTSTTTYPVPGAIKIPVTSGTRTYTGLPDLTLSLIEPGYLDSSGTFHATSTVDYSDTLAAKIHVVNTGTNKTGPWDIEVMVPTSNNANYTHTETMDSLDPGQTVTIDLKLTSGHPRSGEHYITVVLDPDDAIAETNEKNNEDTAKITGV